MYVFLQSFYLELWMSGLFFEIVKKKHYFGCFDGQNNKVMILTHKIHYCLKGSPGINKSLL